MKLKRILWQIPSEVISEQLNSASIFVDGKRNKEFSGIQEFSSTSPEKNKLTDANNERNQGETIEREIILEFTIYII